LGLAAAWWRGRRRESGDVRRLAAVAWHAATAALVLWAAVGWGRTAYQFVRRPVVVHRHAMQWHLAPDSEPVARLAGFLREVDAELPPASRLVVAVPLPADFRDDVLFRHQWMAYLLPRHTLLPSWRPLASTADYWASYDNAGTPPAGAREIARWGPHALYRLRGSP
jgi:hypothetical protein